MHHSQLLSWDEALREVEPPEEVHESRLYCRQLLFNHRQHTNEARKTTLSTNGAPLIVSRKSHLRLEVAREQGLLLALADALMKSRQSCLAVQCPLFCFQGVNELNGICDAKAGDDGSGGVRRESLEMNMKLFEDHAMSSEDALKY